MQNTRSAITTPLLDRLLFGFPGRTVGRWSLDIPLPPYCTKTYFLRYGQFQVVRMDGWSPLVIPLLQVLHARVIGEWAAVTTLEVVTAAAPD